MYSPPLGRFLSRDPLPLNGEPDVLTDGDWFGDRLTMMKNLYGYVENNPVRSVDPSGLVSFRYEIDQNIGGSDPNYLNPIPIAQRNCVLWALKQTNQTWLNSLPDCVCHLCVMNGKPKNPNPKVWTDPSTLHKIFGFHLEAKWCLRSHARPNGSGQQCCYDESGRLITSGESAGTPDKTSPEASFWQHQTDDVNPFRSCKKAGWLDIYFKYRPPNQGRHVNGGTCDKPNLPFSPFGVNPA